MNKQKIYEVMKDTGADDYEAEAVARDLEGMSWQEVRAFAKLSQEHRVGYEPKQVKEKDNGL